jgi:hypothetical protein
MYVACEGLIFGVSGTFYNSPTEFYPNDRVVFVSSTIFWPRAAFC